MSAAAPGAQSFLYGFSIDLTTASNTRRTFSSSQPMSRASVKAS